jgi:hypothetical protein
MHLRHKFVLSNEKIDIVLRNEKPPYSLDRVRTILARHENAFPSKQG